MSRPESPIRTMFDVQRAATRGSERAIRGGLQARRAAGRLMLDGLRTQTTLQRRGLDVAAAATRSYLAAVDATLGAASPADRLTDVDGIGSVTAERLRASGVESLDDLARTEPGLVAEVTATSEERAREWIAAATDRAGSPA